ncbi:MAG: HAD-IA family hydrolase [Bacteroidales bacterium]
MENIKNVILDLGVVLLDLHRSECLDSFCELGIPNVDEVIQTARHGGIFGAYEMGAVSTPEFYEGIRRMSPQTLSDDQIRNAWMKMIADIPAYKLELILSLRENYNVYLLSNTNELHWDWCVEHIFRRNGKDVTDFFDKVWLSNEVHMLKPSSEIFEYVLKDEMLNPFETFFIDDAPANCRMAETFGIGTYTPKAQEDWSHLFTK